MTNIDHQKDQFALEIAEQVMERIGIYVIKDCPIRDEVKLLILDAVEFGIQLGGMGLKEGE